MKKKKNSSKITMVRDVVLDLGRRLERNSLGTNSATLFEVISNERPHK